MKSKMYELTKLCYSDFYNIAQNYKNVRAIPVYYTVFENLGIAYTPNKQGNIEMGRRYLPDGRLAAMYAIEVIRS